MLEMKMTTDLQATLPAEIGFNFDELKNELEERLYYYNHLVVSEDSIKEAKAELAKLRKLKEAIETRRKEVKRKCMAPYNSFESKVKELTSLIDAPVAVINGQIKTFDEQEKEKKSEEISAAYIELVPEDIQKIIPLDRIFDQKWLNKGATMKSIGEAISTIADRTKIDMLYLESSTEPEYLTAVRSKYIETLDIAAAMEHRDRLVETERAFKQREAQRAVLQPQAEEKPPVAVQEPAKEQAAQTSGEEKIYALRLEFHLTMDQANALKRFLANTGIQYTKI